ncbi:hypothetical protein KY092_11270 [Natronomonas gomsonensis]|uniref:hypothetical protein n=1 Tax=Natronomonas gomsonensis TaxID=1046043 RepID=UPI0020CA62ED|nr:hypothetical protein [Natronomonas gomsonensis]MCY4731134.1 hypothetical protein [Natronomonas gomsonensis]
MAEEGDPRWAELTFHGLRRIWATQLKSQDVDSLLVCDWGGWDDLETFLDTLPGDVRARRTEGGTS